MRALLVGLALVVAACAKMGAPFVEATGTYENPCKRGSDYEPVPLVSDPNAPEVPPPTRRKYLPWVPEEAINHVTQAEVKILIHIADEGVVKRVELISENPRGCGLAETTIHAVRNWRFETTEPGVYSMITRFEIH